MRAEKVGRDTMLARIVQMVATAQRSRAPIQRLADRVAGWFVPAVILVALIAFAAWAIFGPEPRLAFGLVAAVTVLDHRLPLRARASDPDVDHGRRRPRRDRRRPDQERGRAGAHGAGRYAGGRQDRDAHGRQAEGRGGGSGGRDERSRAAAARRQHRAASEHPLARAIVDAAAERKIALGRGDGFRCPDRQGRDRDRGPVTRSSSAMRDFLARSEFRSRRWRRRRNACVRTARPRSIWPSGRQRYAASSRSRTR